MPPKTRSQQENPEGSEGSVDTGSSVDPTPFEEAQPSTPTEGGRKGKEKEEEGDQEGSASRLTQEEKEAIAQSGQQASEPEGPSENDPTSTSTETAGIQAVGASSAPHAKAKEALATTEGDQSRTGIRDDSRRRERESVPRTYEPRSPGLRPYVLRGPVIDEFREHDRDRQRGVSFDDSFDRYVGKGPADDSYSTRRGRQMERSTPSTSEEREHSATNMKTKVKPEFLPKFFGETEKDSKLAKDIDGWIDQVTAVIRNTRLDEEVFLTWLPLILKDRALQWYVSARTQSRKYQTWEEWKAALKDRFRVPHYESDLQLKNRRLELDKTKSWSNYYDEKIDLCTKIYGTTATTELLVAELMEGIPRELRAMLAANMRSYTPEGFRYALLQMEVSYSTSKKDKPKNDESRESNGSTKTNGHDRPWNKKRPSYGNRRQGNYPAPDYTKRQDRRKDNRRLDTAQKKEDQDKGQCFVCHKEGHMANKCPEKSDNKVATDSRKPTMKAITNVAFPQGLAIDLSDDEEIFNEKIRSKYQTPKKKKKYPRLSSESSSDSTETRTHSTRRSRHKKSKPKRKDKRDRDLLTMSDEATKQNEKIPQSRYELRSRIKPKNPSKELRQPFSKTKTVIKEEQFTPAYAKARLNSSEDLFTTCIDTGSSLSMIDEYFLKRNLPDVEVTPVPMITVMGVGGSVQVLGKARIEVSLVCTRKSHGKEKKSRVSFPVDFYVTPQMVTKVILGTDVLSKHKMIIDPARNLMTMGGFEGVVCPLTVSIKNSHRKPFQEISNHEGTTRTKEAYKVFVKESITVQPNSTMNLAVRIPHLSNATAQTVLVESTPEFRKGRSSAVVARTLVDTQNPRPVVQFTNWGYEPIRLHPSEKIGEAIQIEDAGTIAHSNAVIGPVEDDQEDQENFLKAIQDLDVNPELSSEQRSQLLDVLTKNRKAFAYVGRPIGFVSSVKLELDTGSAEPISQAPYRASPNGRKIISDTLRELEALDVIEDSNSPWAAPVVLVNREGQIRFCVDYRKLNAVTKMDQYPLPRVDDTLAALSGKKFFSSWDANKGFHQVEVAEKDRDKLAFRTHEGLKTYKRMPFGIHKGPAVFQRLMDIVLGSYKWQCALAYIDDVIVFSDTFEQHLIDIDVILGRIASEGLTLSIKKSHVAYAQMEALGHTISDLGIGTKPKNVEAILNFPVPQTLAELRRFVGKVGHYRRFIQNMSGISRPLTDLTSKDKEWNWTPECQKAFETLKDRMANAPILAYPDQNKPYNLYTDASGEGIGVILQQMGDDGYEHPIIYLSRRLSQAEKNYSATELEGLAIVWAYKKLHAYLDGAKVTVITDHSALRWLFDHDGTSPRLSRWIMYLQQYRPNMTIVYRQGRAHQDVDALSRAPVGEPEDEPDVGLPVSETNQLIVNVIEITTQLDDTFIDEVRELTKQDMFAKKLTFDKENSEAPHLQDFMCQDGLWYKRNPEGGYAMYIPVAAKDHKTAILGSMHDAVIAGHQGIARTIERVKGMFWWENMVKDVSDYVRSCESCQRQKSENRTFPTGLQPIPVPPDRWHTVTIDFTKMPKTKGGYDQATVVVDKFTKRVRIWPSRSTDTAKDVAAQFLDQIVKIHGVPKVVISDRDAIFVSSFWKELWTSFDVKLAYSTAYHPQTDGQTERANRSIKEALRHYVDGKRDDWNTYLPMIEFVLNSSVNTVTKMTPFDLDLGRPVVHPIATLGFETSKDKSLSEWQDQMTVAYYQARERLEAEQKRQAKYANDDKKLQHYDVGDQVMVSAQHLRPDWMPQTHSAGYRSLQPKYYGPYVILKKITEGAYEIDFPKEIQSHPVVNAQYLKPYRPDVYDFPGRKQAPPPSIEVDGEEEYVIEEILDERVRHGSKQYLVKWKGYEESSNSWEPESALEETKAFDEWVNRRPRHSAVRSSKVGEGPSKRRRTSNVAFAHGTEIRVFAKDSEIQPTSVEAQKSESTDSITLRKETKATDADETADRDAATTSTTRADHTTNTSHTTITSSPDPDAT